MCFIVLKVHLGMREWTLTHLLLQVHAVWDAEKKRPNQRLLSSVYVNQKNIAQMVCKSTLFWKYRRQTYKKNLWAVG